jgi:hypothetical protein
MRTRLLRRLAALFAASLLAGPVIVAGCGLLSSDEEPLSGVYAADEFRVRDTTGDITNLGDAGAELELTLTDDGRVTDGRFVVPADVEGACEADESFSGAYERSGDQRVTFDYEGALAEDCFGTGTPPAEVPFDFYENDGTLRAADDAPDDDHGYVLFLDREGAVSEE